MTDGNGVEERSHQDSVFELLRQVHSVFERHGIWHCLIFGTLLGAVRDGDIIAWDHDLDLLVRPADVPRILALNGTLAEERLGFWAGRAPAAQLALNPGRVPWFDPGYLSIMVGSTARGELYAPSVFDDGVLRLYDFEQEVTFWPRVSFPAYFVEELSAALVRGEPFPVPARAEKLLELHYGPDWRTPYRSVRDGGEPRDGHTSHGDLSAPRLAAQIAWCEAQGWDRSAYRGQPAWPRPLAAAGPIDESTRTATTSKSDWWHTLEEVVRHY